MPSKAPDSQRVDGSEVVRAPNEPPSVGKRRLFFAAKLLLAVGLFWLLFELGLLQVEALLLLLHAGGAVVTAVLLCCIHWPIAAWRWHMLLHTQSMYPAYHHTFRISYSAAFVGQFLPGGVGFDIARIGLGLSIPESRLSILALSVIADRILGIMGLMVIGLVAAAAFTAYLPGQQQPVIHTTVELIALFFAAVLVGLIVFALAARRLAPLAENRLWQRGNIYQRALAKGIFSACLYLAQPTKLIAGVLLSIVLHALTVGAILVVASAIGLREISVWKFALAGTLSLGANALPVTPGGVGVGEAAFSQFMLWLEPARGPLPYASAFLACRVIAAFTLLPALAFMPTYSRRSRVAD